MAPPADAAHSNVTHGNLTHGGRMPRVVAVVVTYNRRDLLIEALTAVLGQTRVPDAVIVVDNASTDDTAEIVRSRFPAVRLATVRRNTGGAGGFAYGLALALADAADLVWLMDDDTVPEPGALQAMLGARALHPGGPPALVASRVVWTDGRPHPMNTPRTKPFASKAERLAAAAAGCLPIRSASFVSILVDAGVCRARGLPEADYFLWNDDFVKSWMEAQVGGATGKWKGALLFGLEQIGEFQKDGGKFVIEAPVEMPPGAPIGMPDMDWRE